MVYITASGATTVATSANGILVQLNKALTTETITLAAGGITFGIITGAASAGQQFRYYGLRGQGAITVNPSASTVDITVSLINRP